MNNKKVVKDKTLGIDMMHYKANNISFWLVVLTIALNIAMFLIIYKTTGCTASIQLGLDLIVNVLLLLIFFLAAEKNKRYSMFWGKTSIVLGVIQIARIFWIPLIYYLMFKKDSTKGLNDASFAWCVVLLILSAASIITAGVITLKKYEVLKNHKPLLEIEGAKKDVRT